MEKPLTEEEFKQLAYNIIALSGNGLSSKGIESIYETIKSNPEKATIENLQKHISKLKGENNGNS